MLLFKNIGHAIYQKKHLYVLGSLGLVSIFLVLVSVFLATKSGNPYTSELAFIEKSLGKIGSVIPASCDSRPPTNDDGKCPPQVDVSIKSVASNLGLTITNVTSPDGYPVVFEPDFGGDDENAAHGDRWNVGSGVPIDENETPADGILTAQIHYNSTGGATACWAVWRNNWIPPQGPITVSLRTRAAGPNGRISEEITYTIRCTDGVYWTSEKEIKAIAQYTIRRE